MSMILKRFAREKDYFKSLTSLAVLGFGTGFMAGLPVSPFAALSAFTFAANSLSV